MLCFCLHPKNVSGLNPSRLLKEAYQRPQFLVRQMEKETENILFDHYVKLLAWGEDSYLGAAEKSIDQIRFTADKVDAYLRLYQVVPRQHEYLEKAIMLSKKLFFMFNTSTSQLLWPPDFIKARLEQDPQDIEKHFQEILHHPHTELIAEREAVFEINHMVHPLPLSKIKKTLKELTGDSEKESLGDLPRRLTQIVELPYEAGQIYLSLAEESFDYWLQAVYCALALIRKNQLGHSYEIYKALLEYDHELAPNLLILASRNFLERGKSEYAAHLLALTLKRFPNEMVKEELLTLLPIIPENDQKREAHAVLAKLGESKSVEWLCHQMRLYLNTGYLDLYTYLCSLLVDHPKLSAIAYEGVENLMRLDEPLLGALLLLELFKAKSPHVSNQRLYEILEMIPSQNLDPFEEFHIWEKFINLTAETNPFK